jgi:hypothetical protein
VAAAALAIVVWVVVDDDGGDALVAQPIAVGEAVTSSIGADEDGRAFVVEVTGDAPLAGVVQPIGDGDVLLEVTHPDRVLEFVNRGGAGAAEHFVAVNGTPGEYRVVVRGAPGTEFELSIEPVEMVAMNVDETVRDTITEPGDLALVEVDMAENPSLLIDVVPEQSLDVVLEVTSEGGQQEADVGAAGRVETVIVQGGDDDRVRVVISSFGSTSGGFALSVRPADVVELSVGDTASGTITAGGGVDIFDVPTPDVQTLVVEVDPDDTLDALLTVTDPTGADLSADEGLRGGIERLVVDSTSPGRSLIVVRGQSWTAGGYTLSVQAA